MLACHYEGFFPARDLFSSFIVVRFSGNDIYISKRLKLYYKLSLFMKKRLSITLKLRCKIGRKCKNWLHVNKLLSNPWVSAFRTHPCEPNKWNKIVNKIEAHKWVNINTLWYFRNDVKTVADCRGFWVLGSFSGFVFLIILGFDCSVFCVVGILAFCYGVMVMFQLSVHLVNERLFMPCLYSYSLPSLVSAFCLLSASSCVS